MTEVVKWDKARFHADDPENGEILIPYIRISTRADNDQLLLMSIIVSSDVSSTMVSARCLFEKTIVFDLTVYETFYHLHISPKCTQMVFQKFMEALKSIKKHVVNRRVSERIAKVVPKIRCEWNVMHKE